MALGAHALEEPPAAVYVGVVLRTDSRGRRDDRHGDRARVQPSFRHLHSPSLSLRHQDRAREIIADHPESFARIRCRGGCAGSANLQACQDPASKALRYTSVFAGAVRLLAREES
jgi:hypothetical protein